MQQILHSLLKRSRTVYIEIVENRSKEQLASTIKGQISETSACMQMTGKLTMV